MWKLSMGGFNTVYFNRGSVPGAEGHSPLAELWLHPYLFSVVIGVLGSNLYLLRNLVMQSETFCLIFTL
jgi:hypothetical protein